MSLSICNLGSGSGGNATLLRLGQDNRATHMLIDCGFSPRETRRRLATLGLDFEHISDILLTHLDRDHFYPTWIRVIERHGIRLHLHRRQQRRAASTGLNFRQVELFEDVIERPAAENGVHIESVPFAHDALGTVGFIIEYDGTRLGYATDLGHVPATLFERFIGLHALAFESNYDRKMQLDSPRPQYLKQRIMGGSGHLSNDEALAAICRIAKSCTLSQITLLHLSRQCNCPTIVRSLYEREAPELFARLTITNQFQPTPMLSIVPDQTAPVTEVPRRRPFQPALF